MSKHEPSPRSLHLAGEQLAKIRAAAEATCANDRERAAFTMAEMVKALAAAYDRAAKMERRAG